MIDFWGEYISLRFFVQSLKQYTCEKRSTKPASALVFCAIFMYNLYIFLCIKTYGIVKNAEKGCYYG